MHDVTDAELRLAAATGATPTARAAARRTLDERRTARADAARGAPTRGHATAPEPPPRTAARSRPAPYRLPTDWHRQFLAELGPVRPCTLAHVAAALAAIEARYRTEHDDTRNRRGG